MRICLSAICLSFLLFPTALRAGATADPRLARFAAEAYEGVSACERDLTVEDLSLEAIRSWAWEIPEDVIFHLAQAPAAKVISGSPGRRGSLFIFAHRGNERFDGLGDGISLYLVHQSGALRGGETRQLIKKFVYEFEARAFARVRDEIPDPFHRDTAVVRIYNPVEHPVTMRGAREETANIAQLWLDHRRVKKEAFVRLVQALQEQFEATREDLGF